MLAQRGFDTLVVDLEHMAMTIKTAEEIVRAVEATGEPTDTILRVPEGTTAWVKRALDTGADGILVPAVKSRGKRRPSPTTHGIRRTGIAVPPGHAPRGSEPRSTSAWRRPTS